MTTTSKKLVPNIRFPEFKNSGEWAEKKLGDISYYISSNYSVSSALEQGKYYLYDANKLIGFTNEYLCDRDYISIIKDGSGVGRTRYMKAYSNFIGTMNGIVPNDDISPYFLFSLINKINFQQYVKGATIPHIYYSDYSKHIVYITTKEEQKKIADFLSSVDELIKLEQKKLEELQEYKQGLLQNLFPKKNQKVPDLRFPEFENSGEWVEKKLGDIGEIITGKTPNTSNRELWKDEIAFVTPSDIKGNKYQYTTERMVTNINIKLLPVGAIMFSCIATIGKIAIAKVICTTNQQINSIIIDVEKINNEFIYYSLQSIISKIKAKYEKDAFSIINKTEFSNITIQVSPLKAEQQKIAVFLSSVDELIELEQKKLEKLKEYKKGFLQQLFPN